MKIAVRATAAALALAHVTCQSVPLLAPPGSSMAIFANPNFIASHGGVSRITVVLTDPTGAPVADGTVVMFLSTLGRVDERGLTNDGVAHVNLISDSRSGIATVTAFSGGDAANPAPSPSPTTTSTGAPVRLDAADSSSVRAAFANSESTTVTIGNAAVDTVHVRAEPGRIGSSRTTTIVATVYGAGSSTGLTPLANVPVFFKVGSRTPTGDQTEFFDNAGPIFTDNNGEARAVLRTRRDTTGTVNVTAEAPGADSMVESEPVTIPVF